MTYLRGIDVSKAEHADAFTAITGLPVSVTQAHIIGGALSVAIARIGTFSISNVCERREAHSDEQNSNHSK